MKDAFCIILIALLFVFIIVIFSSTDCFYCDLSDMEALAKVKGEYGVIMNPNVLGYLVHEERWQGIQYKFSDVFYYGIPSFILQFIVPTYDDLIEKEREKSSHRNRCVEQYKKKALRIKAEMSK